MNLSRLCPIAWAVALTCPASGVNAAIWIVDASGGGDAVTIQGGMALASAGDSVLVQPGTYPGGILAKSGVALIGVQGAEHTIVDADGPVECLSSASGSVDVLIRGLTFTGSDCDGGLGSALVLYGQVALRECAVEGNMSRSSTIEGFGSLEIVETRFARNSQSCLDVPVLLVSHDGDVSIESCVFDDEADYMFAILSHQRGSASITGCIFRDISYAVAFLAGRLTVSGNLFERADGWLAGSTHEDVVIRGNTFVRSGPTMDPRPGWVIEGNLSTGGDDGFSMYRGLDGGVVFRCNNSWGHARNWVGFDDPAGVDGNFSAPPLYCDPAAGDYHLAQGSRCLPPNNACGILVGAFRQGCGTVGIEPQTWGRIKSAWRSVPAAR